MALLLNSAKHLRKNTSCLLFLSMSFLGVFFSAALCFFHLWLSAVLQWCDFTLFSFYPVWGSWICSLITCINLVKFCHYLLKYCLFSYSFPSGHWIPMLDLTVSSVSYFSVFSLFDLFLHHPGYFLLTCVHLLILSSAISVLLWNPSIKILISVIVIFSTSISIYFLNNFQSFPKFS